MKFKEFSDNQRRVYIDSIQLYDAYMDAYQKSRAYRGGMHWKKAKGREYLFRTLDRYGNGKSLGVRSEETEKTYQAFHRAKKEIQGRLGSLKDRMREQARFCKAAMIQRVPKVVSSILRVLDEQKVLGQSVTVVGTNIMYAFEAAAGVFFERSILATQDMDLMWDTRPKLALVMDKKLMPGGMISLLKKADRSFERMRRSKFRAVNKDGYMVDLIKSMPKDIRMNEKQRMGDPGDLEAAEIRNLQWLVSSPKFSQVVIGEDGYPSLMTGPDPRAFALHKIWLSRQKDRNPLKKNRDLKQGLAIAQILINYLPQYEFNKSEMRMFPAHVRDEARKLIG
ncbi:MAG: nucleotidyltransferase domain-containing protein [Deltaproteobacteria bacterium]|nr:nucleotidyltransferase domain-containing protein [Deltaproteobacteria bacterium]MBW2676678.1 nucleotidyltransferase domain-containing protein [Deltaproteobacteria bacterium]